MKTLPKKSRAKLLKWLKQTSAKCLRAARQADRRENFGVATALFGATDRLDKAIHYLKEEAGEELR